MLETSFRKVANENSGHHELWFNAPCCTHLCHVHTQTALQTVHCKPQLSPSKWGMYVRVVDAHQQGAWREKELV